MTPRDRVLCERPFTAPPPVLPFFVCFRFRNGATYAASIQHASCFPPDVIRDAQFSIHDRANALRCALSMPTVPPPNQQAPRRFHAK